MGVKNIKVHNDTDARFDNYKKQVQMTRERHFTDDEAVNKLLDLWEDIEAGVLEVKPR